MNKHPTTIIAELRALMPARALQDHEARGIAERQAMRWLETYELIEPPVDVGLICELPRIRVRVEPNLTDSGLTHWNRGAWVIGVNRDDSRTRRRFTLAHEFKHILDHPHIDTIYNDERRQPDAKRAELMCDQFAACLLMPRPWVKRLWAQGMQDVTALGLIFNVSPAAMSRRLQELGLVAPRQRWRTNKSDWSAPTYFRKNTLTFVA
jgi:Zn-dependent peptidase ImmA (M78 family)